MLALTVPNQPPGKQAARRIALVGEAPGLQERSWCTCQHCRHEFASEWRDVQGAHVLSHCPACYKRDGLLSTPRPLVGPSGHTLNQLLAEAGIDRAACWLGNVCQHQPPGNDITRFEWAGPEIQQGLAQLRADLAAYQPHFCLLLGGTPLRAFKGPGKFSIGDWRGSLFLASDIVPGCKVMATYHPAALLREAGLTGVTRFDMARAREEARVDGLEVPVDTIDVALTKEQLIDRLQLVQEHGLLAGSPVAVDIEGYVDWVSCIGFATGPNRAFVVPFIRADGTSYWDEADEVELWQAVADVLTDPLVPKVLQNYLYDAFVLAWSYGILIRGLRDDIMLKHFELYCEFEKSLAFQTSIYTRHPYYKFERKSDDETVQLTYCGKDCCRTFECNVAQDAKHMPRQREHYQFNMQLLAPLLWMELRGIKYDYTQAQTRLTATQHRIHALQDRINREAASQRPALAGFYEALEQPGTGLTAILATAFCLADPRERRVCEETSWQPMRWRGDKPATKRKAGQVAEPDVPQLPADRVAATTGSLMGSSAQAYAGRWVKAGKRLATEADHQAAIAAGAWQGNNAPTLSASDTGTWLQPVTKHVERSCKVAVATLEDVQRFAKDSCKADCKRAIQLCRSSTLRDWLPHERGELATLLGLSVKVNATGAGRPTKEQAAGIEKDANWLLYECWGLPKQFIKEGNRLTTRLASGDQAVLKAWAKSQDERALIFLELRRAITETRSLRAAPDADGRIRCGYNLVGTDTHRLSCYGTPTGSSTLNLQTVTKDHRSLYQADEGCYLCQRDLSGADGWTVAAYCAMLGDPTMLEDYRARLKPAQILTVMLDRGTVVNSMTRDELRVLCKPITEDNDPRYFYNKRGQHGWSYLMGKQTTSDQILTDSYKKTGKPIYVPPNQLEQVRDTCFFVRYPGVPRMHAYWARVLMDKGEVTASNGFTRRFYGRKVEWRRVDGRLVKAPAQETLRKLVAHLPQVYTTYATTLALHRLWVDADNRLPNSSLRIEPLHTVHDSLLTQFQQADLEWARGKLKEWFQNELLIATTKLVIPASGTYGPSWGMQPYTL